jgi:thiol-disulfide isomerase/thioredoxin
MAGKMSKKTWLIVAILIIAVGAIVGIALSRNSPSPSEFTLPIITWDETTISSLEGTPVVLVFWSISCYWCRQQLPYFEDVAQQNEEEIKVIAINIRDSASRIQTFFGDYEPTMTIALDNNREAFADYCLAYNNTRGAIPFTLFVDSEGIIKDVQIGAFRSEAELRDTVDSII